MAAATVMSAVNPLTIDQHTIPASLTPELLSAKSFRLPPGVPIHTAIDSETAAQVLTALATIGRKQFEARLSGPRSPHQSLGFDLSARSPLTDRRFSRTTGSSPSSNDGGESLQTSQTPHSVAKQHDQRSPQPTRVPIHAGTAAATERSAQPARVRTEATETSESKHDVGQLLMNMAERWVNKQPYAQHTTRPEGESLNFVAEGDTESPFCTLVKPLKAEIDALLDAKFGTDRTRGADKDSYTGRIVLGRHEYGIHNKLRSLCTADDAWLTEGGDACAKEKAMELYSLYKSDPSLVPDITFCSPLLRNQQTAMPNKKVHDLFTEDGEHLFAYLWALREQGGCVASSVMTPEDEFDAPLLRGQSFAPKDRQWTKLGFEYGAQLHQRAELFKAIALYTLDEIQMRTGKKELTLEASLHANFGGHCLATILPDSAFEGRHGPNDAGTALFNGQSTMVTFHRGGLQGPERTFTPTDAKILYVNRSNRPDRPCRVDFDQWLSERQREHGKASRKDDVLADAGRSMDAITTEGGIAVA